MSYSDKQLLKDKDGLPIPQRWSADENIFQEISEDNPLFVTDTQNFKTELYTIPSFNVSAWSGWSNQCNNDGLEIVSTSASDTQKCTIWYTAFGSTTLSYETVTLTGTTPKSLVVTNIGNVMGIFLGDADGQNVTAAVGTITFREASGDQTITTLTPGKISTGLAAFNLVNKHIEIYNESGVLYWSSVKIPTVGTVGKLYGFDIRNIKITSRLHLISDVTGSVCQIVVWSN
jgi:hypothetical protein